MTRAEAPPRRQSSTALFFILIAACESATPSHNDLGRRYSNHAAWDTVRLINPADSGWTRFRYLDADSSNIVGYDHITRRLYAYNLLTGRPAWSVRQSGLQAFSHPIDVEIDNRGYAWLLDTRDKTVSSFDPAGKLAITNPVPGVAR